LAPVLRSPTLGSSQEAQRWGARRKPNALKQDLRWIALGKNEGQTAAPFAEPRERALNINQPPITDFFEFVFVFFFLFETRSPSHHNGMTQIFVSTIHELIFLFFLPTEDTLVSLPCFPVL
jgi:hypothetical protein